MEKLVNPKEFINAVINLPGDKSIAHRVMILGAISNGVTKIKNFPFNKSCMSTFNCLRNLGVDIKIKSGKVIINGHGICGLSEPKKILDAGTSATTLRLLLGFLVAQNFPSQIKCSGSLKNRPMDRVIKPLKKMGANIVYDGNFKICPAKLSPIRYKMPVASAQVKSAILFASLYCSGMIEIIEPIKSRDHTEHLINYFGGNINFSGSKIFSNKGKVLTGKKINLPADISTAAFFIVLAVVFPGAHLILNDVLINPRRMGFINVLKKMGANIKIVNCYEIYKGESVADIEVFYSHLKSIEISGEIIIDMIDEIPAFVIAALFADGRSIIKDAGELKFKESDRIMSIAEGFNKLGAKIKPTDDGMIIESGFNFNFARVFSHNDHRIAMSLAVFALAAKNKLIIDDVSCVADSFPEFFEYVDTFF